MQSLDIISINIWQILISLCNLVLLFLILKKFLYKPVHNVLAQRSGDAGFHVVPSLRQRAVRHGNFGAAGFGTVGAFGAAAGLASGWAFRYRVSADRSARGAERLF